MNRFFTIFTTKLSWRFFALFFIAAILPVLMLSVSSYYQISNELFLQSQLKAKSMAKTIGMDIYEKIRYLSSEFRQFIDKRQYRDETAVREYLTLSRGKNLFIIDSKGHINLISGELEKISDQFLLKADSQAKINEVNVIIDQSKNNRIFMLYKHEDGYIISTEIVKEELWYSEYLNTLEEHICIISPEYEKLFCNRDPYNSWLSQTSQYLSRQESGYFKWSEKEKELYTAYWTIFLAPHFSFPKWTVTVSDTPETALAPVKAFQATFIKVFLLTLGMVILLSMWTINRNLVPLKRLLTATRKVTQGDFSQRVALESKDEFHELGEAFNNMAFRLGNQFTFLSILADLDNSFQRSNSLVGITQSLIDSIHKCPQVKLKVIGCIDSNENMLLVWNSESANDDRSLVQYDSFPLAKLIKLPNKIQTGDTASMRKILPMLGAVKVVDDNELILVPAVRDKTTLAFVILESTKKCYDSDNEIIQLLSQIVDLFGIKLESFFLGQNLHFLAHHDALTGLPNRTFVLDAIDNDIKVIQEKNNAGAVILIDLNRFKAVNDTQGHAAGDELLVQVARRFKHVMRQNDIISRLSGDEFIAVLTDLPERMSFDIAIRGAKRLNEVLSDPFKIGEVKYDITASMGIAFYPKDGKTAIEVLKAADAAMYAVKSSPSTVHYGFYSEEIHNKMLYQIEIERELIPAIKNENFVLYYQPVVDPITEQVVSAEALVRWQHSDKGLLAPDVFISIAEKSTLMNDLGKVVLRQACSDLAGLKERGSTINHFSINVSARQINSHSFADFILATLKEFHLEPRDIVLEITETAIMENYETSQFVIDELRSSGVKISIDDFGTGFASLSYLKQLPADYLKIDRTFVSGLPDDKQDGALIESLASLGDIFNLSLIAEGVETQGQVEYLIKKGIHNLQGYYYSKPMSLDEFETYLYEFNLLDKCVN